MFVELKNKKMQLNVSISQEMVQAAKKVQNSEEKISLMENRLEELKTDLEYCYVMGDVFQLEQVLTNLISKVNDSINKNAIALDTRAYLIYNTNRISLFAILSSQRRNYANTIYIT